MGTHRILHLILRKEALAYIGKAVNWCWIATFVLWPMLYQCMLIHNSPLQPFSQDYGLASHTTHVVCVFILYVSGGTYSLTPNDRIFRSFLMAGLFTLRVFARNLLRGNRRRTIFFHISFFMPGLTSNKPRHYLLDYGNFYLFIYLFF